MANHLTPTELSELVDMERVDVITKCREMCVPIFNGRVDKTLFISNLRLSEVRSVVERRRSAA